MGYVSVFILPKDGNSEDECEDAAAVVPESPRDAWVTGPITAVVSDGASESMLAKDWAWRLVATVVGKLDSDPALVRSRIGFAEVMREAMVRWGEWIDGYEARRAESGRPVQWYERPKLERGAYATLLALHFDGIDSWEAAALGDSCLFHLRGFELIRAFPLQQADEFSVTPKLVNSREQDGELLAAHVETASGKAEPSDQFFLCTDAMAAWFLQRAASGSKPWYEVMDLTRAGDQTAFAQWADGERAAGRMRNDDIALIHLDLG